MNFLCQAAILNLYLDPVLYDEISISVSKLDIKKISEY